MTPAAFIAKWRNVALKERSAAQTHFNDLCALLGVEDPVSADPNGEFYCFERGATKATGGNGWADVWKRGCFGWEYKGPKADLNAALKQLLQYAGALENPPLLITCDMDRVEVRTNFQNYRSETTPFLLDELADAAVRDRLRRLWTDPQSWRPDRTRTQATREAADAFAALAGRLASRGIPPTEVARFTDRMVFCLFADDIGLLPDGLLDDMLTAGWRNPGEFSTFCGSLFDTMAKQGGGHIGFRYVEWFNGGLFNAPPSGRSTPPPALTKTEIADLRTAASLDWSEMEPAIFGTLFERFLNPEKRGQIGAFYTDPVQIAQLVRPVVLAPLEAEWDAARAAMETEKPTAAGRKRAAARLDAFTERLRTLRVLDPACGSGNFLYVVLHALKDLEKRVRVEAEALGFPQPLDFATGPHNVLGIERDEYAAELARLVVWIGEIQWMRRNGFSESRNPILSDLSTIACRDALLKDDGTEAAWPEAECIVGNPPFLGTKKQLRFLGADYTRRLRTVYAGRVPGFSDLVGYWFEKARSQITAGLTKRVGLVATNSIRGGVNRRVLDRIVETPNLAIFDAYADEPWVSDGAAVRVSIVSFGIPPNEARQLNGAPTTGINADLTAADGVNMTFARPLSQNAAVCFVGTVKSGPFDIGGDLARAMLVAPLNPNGRPNSDVVKPYINTLDVVRRQRDVWVVDFGTSMQEQSAALYEQPFEHVLAKVKPLRSLVRRPTYRNRWWLFAEPCAGMRRALLGLRRYIATPSVAVHRVFVWRDASINPDHQLVAIARDDDTTFGVLHSRFHESWSLRLGTSLEDRPRYTPTTTFETFPFPDGLTPDLPAATTAAHPRAAPIADAARRLHALREAWLNPPDLIRREPEIVPGFPDRLLPRDPDAAALLAKRTLTALYNARPAWLADAHAALDAAVAAAYGWPAGIAEDDALSRLLALNLTRAG